MTLLFAKSKVSKIVYFDELSTLASWLSRLTINRK